jgi:prepilin-type N-terminal cleavage/methylation domain-containing protein
MIRRDSEKGFTLVELAIVMTIIGLLIGGILKGQTLMQNARVTAEVAEVKAISAADTTFKDMYNAVPGDMLAAGTRLVGCPGASGVSCNPFTGAGAGTAGDGIVGPNTWAATTATWAAPANIVTIPAGATKVDDEGYLFFSHLLLANLIGNVTTQGLNSATPYAFGVTQPDIKIGGGFRVGYDFGNVSPAFNGIVTSAGITGTVILQVASAQLTGVIGTQTVGSYTLTPLQASMVDIKMDDGRPGTGYVQSFGMQTTCADTVAADGGTAASPIYKTTITTADCGLLFRIEN